jgi:hypothetical protein
VNPFTDLTIDLKFFTTGSYSLIPAIDKLDVVQSICKVCHNPLQQIADQCRPSTIYSKKIYHFGNQQETFANKYKRDFDRFSSQSLGLYYSSSLETACYMDDFLALDELRYFEGMKNSGTSVNGVSLGGFAVVGNMDFTGLNSVGTPVEIFIVNPNQMIYNPTAPTPVVGGGTLVVSSGGGTRPTPAYPPTPIAADPSLLAQGGQNTGLGG